MQKQLMTMLVKPVSEAVKSVAGAVESNRKCRMYERMAKVAAVVLLAGMGTGVYVVHNTKQGTGSISLTRDGFNASGEFTK